MFAVAVLRDWRLAELIETAELLVSELVTNAVKSTGVVDESPGWSALNDLALIHVRLVLLEDGVVIEVVDREMQPPVISDQSLDAEGGRGLLLIETLSRQWDFYFPPSGGKVVWCELQLPAPLVSGLPRRVRPKKPDTSRQPAPCLTSHFFGE